MLIRTASQGDTSAIAKLSSQLGYPVDSNDVGEYLFQIERDKSHVVFLAEDDEQKSIGWIHVFVTVRLFSPPFAEVGGLIIDEKSRGEGIGKILLDEAEKWALYKGCTALMIRSNVIRESAHKFYEKAGYQIVKNQKVLKKELVPDTLNTSLPYE